MTGRIGAADTPTPPWEDVDKDGIRRPVTPTLEAATEATNGDD